MGFISPIFASKLKTKKAEVEYYDADNKMKSASFEYYARSSKLHYGSRVGLEIFKVSFFHHLQPQYDYTYSGYS